MARVPDGRIKLLMVGTPRIMRLHIVNDSRTIHPGSVDRLIAQVGQTGPAMEVGLAEPESITADRQGRADAPSPPHSGWRLEGLANGSLHRWPVRHWRALGYWAGRECPNWPEWPCARPFPANCRPRALRLPESPAASAL